jgi:hypothetical protein
MDRLFQKEVEYLYKHMKKDKEGYTDKVNKCI